MSSFILDLLVVVVEVVWRESALMADMFLCYQLQQVLFVVGGGESEVGWW